MDVTAGRGHQLRKILQAPAVPRPDRRALVRDGPEVALAAHDVGLRRFGPPGVANDHPRDLAGVEDDAQAGPRAPACAMLPRAQLEQARFAAARRALVAEHQQQLRPDGPQREPAGGGALAFDGLPQAIVLLDLDAQA